ncbi:MAG TPA: hypothetical protein VG267_07285 [Terracidiphilus sp.]|nr:hypothetical protein [Terracidiphilus sp.]
MSSGGGLVSGRITGIAIDPTNSSNIYVAAAGGGVWNTTNGGTSWTPLTDTQTTLAMGAIAIAPTNHLKIYAGTGEANNAGDSNHGEGILVSDDGGSTWTLETASGAFAGVVFGQIAVDPTNADTAYAAVGGYSQNGNYGNTGIWKTNDGGTTWTNMTGAVSLDTGAPWSAVVIDPNTPTTIYAAIGDFADSYGDNGIYRSVDSGAHWSVLANGPNSTALPTIGRIALAVSPAAKTAGKHVLYVAVAGNPYAAAGGLIYFGRSDNADAATPTFTNLTSGTPDFLGGENGGGQGWYDIVVNVDLVGNVYCAGVENYNTGGTDLVIRSTTLGVSWTDISSLNNFEPHTDSHAIAFDSSFHMFLGSDGGIFRYNPSGPSWTDLNGNLNTIQLTGIGLHPTSTTIVVGGSQDNGTELYNNSLLWTEVDGGDGGFAQIAPTDSSRCYAIHPVGSFGPSYFFRRSDDGCSSWYAVSSGLTFNTYGDFYPPFVVDPTSADHVLLGMDYLNETTDGGTAWTAIGKPGVNNFNPSDNNIDTVALSPQNGINPQVIYAATGGSFASSSQIFVTSNDGAAWTQHDLPACPGSCRVNQIVTDPNDLTGQTAFAVISTFTGGGRHVYRTTNEGASWTDITGNLTDKPTWSVQVDTDTNETAYVSTDAGVYSSPSPYSTWALYGTGLPNAQGVDLEINHSLHLLGLATHGRGAWEILASSSLVAQTINFTQPTSPVYNGHAPLTLSATGGASGNPVVFSLVSGPGSLSGTNNNTLTITGTGTIVVAANQAGNSTYAAAPQVTRSVMVLAPTPAVLTSPTPGSTLSGASVNFGWTAGGGVSKYEFRLGTTGAGSKDVYNAAAATTTTLSTGVITVPAYGVTLYARLYSFINGVSQYTDYTYKESGTPVKAVLTSPTPGATLGTSATFNWTAGGGVTSYEFRLGTMGAGSKDVYNPSGSVTSALTTGAVSIPAYGVTLYARLYSWINGAWQINDYTYMESGATVPAALTSPTPGSTLTGTSATFSWTAGGGIAKYEFRLGTTGAGSKDVYNSTQATTTALSTPLISGIPAYGVTLYARLYSFTYTGASQYTDYTYKESGTPVKAALTSPTPGTTLGSTATFTWTKGGGVTTYEFRLGTTGPGSKDVYNPTGSVTSALTTGSVAIPSNGVALYARLYSWINGAWQYTDYTYTEP